MILADELGAGKPTSDIHPDGANFVAFLPDGRRIVTASGFDGTGLVWDVSDLKEGRSPGPPDG
jgi:WD40 repeat protein